MGTVGPCHGLLGVSVLALGEWPLLPNWIYPGGGCGRQNVMEMATALREKTMILLKSQCIGCRLRI